MKLKKELLALSLAFLVGNSITAKAYSESELTKIHNKIEKYLDIEISSNNQSDYDDLNRIMHVQTLIHSIPFDKIDEFFTSLVDTIDRDNGNAYDREAGRLKNYFSKEDIHVLNNQSGDLNIPKTIFVFMDYSSYGDYRVYMTSYEDGYYYFITDQENNLLANFVSANLAYNDTNYSYTNLSNKGFTISNIEDFLNDNDKSNLLADNHTYEELKDLRKELASSDQIKRGLCPKN